MTPAERELLLKLADVVSGMAANERLIRGRISTSFTMTRAGWEWSSEIVYLSETVRLQAITIPEAPIPMEIVPLPPEGSSGD